MILDQLVFEEAYKAGVEKLCFASSACVYPPHLQNDPSYLLKEEDVDFSKDVLSADCEYGWAKLMGEIGIKAYYKQHGMKYCGARIFTAYGPRENETHAVIALIAKAFIKMEPYEIWGTGEQDRNFTYVEDVVEGLINVAEKVDDGSCINVGREDRITINELAELIFELVGWRPKKIIHNTSKPEGVASRAADLTKARKILNWEPKVSIKEGLKRTIEWYYSTHSLEEVKKDFEKRLLER
jgi:UDP-glucose 4-epimerase